MIDFSKNPKLTLCFLISQYKTAEGISEQFKANNQMEWVAQMNNIRQRVTKIVNEEIIYL
ncbi:MAG: TnpV protein [Ruminococcaceae bacterium]|nr:TnpV protein [Oscillospiraceae bacterium]